MTIFISVRTVTLTLFIRPLSSSLRTGQWATAEQPRDDVHQTELLQASN